MTAETALALGQAAAHVFRSRREGRRRIVIGKEDKGILRMTMSPDRGEIERVEAALARLG